MTMLREEVARVNARWERLTPRSVWPAIALVLVASGLMAITRVGGLVVDEPRSSLRLMLIGVWGWLGLAIGIWATGRTLSHASATTRPPPLLTSLALTLAMVGWAHVPVIVLGLVVFVAAGLMQLLGPGLVVGAVVLAVALPVALVTGTRHVFALSWTGAAVAVVVPYAFWLLIAARHVHRQISHLL
jgi:hypothetical protein